MIVDAVIPTWNRADTVPRAIESALAQSRRPDAVIVVDDGSSDETSAAVEAFGELVTCVVQPHRGVAAARNAGVAASDAEFIAFLDSDDVWDTRHLERIEGAIAATSGRAWLYFSDLRFSAARDASPSIWTACGFAIRGDHQIQVDGAAWGLLSRQPMMMPASAVRRDTYLDLGGQAECLVSREDTHLFLKLCLGGPVCAVAGIAGDASVSTEGLSKRELNTLSYWESTRWLYADILARYRQLPTPQKSMLQTRLAEAEWQLARALSRRRPFQAAAHLARAARGDRRVVTERFRRFIARVPSRAASVGRG